MLGAYEVLDTGAEADFDDITIIAAQLAGTPMAAVSFVDAERQWFKSMVGLPVRETERGVPFCAHAIERPGAVMVVPDAAADARLADNRLVTGAPGVRLCAGSPLVAPGGEALGALCVLDTCPRELDAAQLGGLAALGRQVVALLEARRAARRLGDALDAQVRAERDRLVATEELQAAFELAPVGVSLIGADGRYQRVNPAVAALVGREPCQVVGRTTPS